MKRRVTTVAGIALIVAACVFAGLAVWRYVLEQRAGDEYAQIAQIAESPSSRNDNSSSESYTSPIDFAALEETCPDAYAWVRSEGTGVDFPIVQAEGDQSYYLTHSAQKVSNLAGAIFTQDANSKDFTDPVTVVYGHNLTNGKMFSCLHDWADRDFFDEHRDIVVYLPDKELHYRVFAAYTTDSQNILAKYDFSDPEVLQQYLDSVRSMKSMSTNVTDDVRLGIGSKLLILSTCNDDHYGRFIVQAVMVTEEA